MVKRAAIIDVCEYLGWFRTVITSKPEQYAYQRIFKYTNLKVLRSLVFTVFKVVTSRNILYNASKYISIVWIVCLNYKFPVNHFSGS